MTNNQKNNNKTDQVKSSPQPGFATPSSLFANYQLVDAGGYITQEFQDFGYRLAVELSDLKHKSLYIKMAKEIDRGILEQALRFVADASQAKSKARLFMWKVKDLQKNTDTKPPQRSKKLKP